VTITREISGDGLNVAIRGLGTNFTRVPAQQAPIADRLDRPHRQPEHQPRGRPRPVPDRAVHPADGDQVADRRA
jgi:hypothetical protein